MIIEVAQFDDLIGELDTKLNDQKRKKTDARRQMDEMVKGI